MTISLEVPARLPGQHAPARAAGLTGTYVGQYSRPFPKLEPPDCATSVRALRASGR